MSLRAEFESRGFRVDALSDEQLEEVRDLIIERYDKTPPASIIRIVIDEVLTRADREEEQANRGSGWVHETPTPVERRDHARSHPTIHWRTLLDFEREHPGPLGTPKLRAIRARFDCKPWVYTRQLEAVVETDYAREYAPDICDAVKAAMAERAERLGRLNRSIDELRARHDAEVSA